ncbi:FAD-dependent monooxygenase [Amycolatopsis thermophila]|uniref:2-polyprenyl-6-methoxyphenol hydroxylase-like FAD-dependent oxidoreductase n=1 Tax=Amycolatopsis thermophila TaxID=206084 RepID=A0ABU0F6B7_9PSEU|nr:FAD-dependent monooxygenase [Amycolatopsis thermophila]MDQ0382869.1 2-polyprenyl-6-methoxyphenol hydroxylase-like FAD-dependent oxidoreductase [Amycolatopsis thermophila]
MPAVRNVLVVGGGSAGAATAILLADAGISVDLVEIKPDVTALGSGITLQGNALRVLRELGVLDECLAEGYPADKVVLRAPDSAGTVLAEMQNVRSGGPELPASMGMYRPTLARILMNRAAAAGVKTRFGTTLNAIEQDDTGVEVRFSDGSARRYDVVVGADGLRSKTRLLLGIALETKAVGMGIWRVFASRPPEVTSSELFYGGPCYTAGYTPTSQESLYGFLVEDAQDRTGLSATEQLDIVRRLAAHYHGPWDAIRASITDPGTIHYTWYETHLLDPPWARGRVVLVGEAVHTCPPTIAQGGAMALEDASVLAELLLAADAVDDELWDEFTVRRYGRVKEIVDASLQVTQWQLDQVEGDIPGLMTRIAELASRPA